MGFLDEKQMRMILDHYCNFDELQFRFENGIKTYKGSFFEKKDGRDTEVFRFKLVDDQEKILLFLVSFDEDVHRVDELERQVHDEVPAPKELLLISNMEITDYGRKKSYCLYAYGWAIRKKTGDLNDIFTSITRTHILEEIFKF